MEVTVMFCLLLAGAVGAENSEFLTHLGRVWEFSCGEPQKRSIPVSSLKTLPADERYYPVVTVLHRCDNYTGMCAQGEGYGCGPASSEEVALVFRVEKALPKPRARRGGDSRVRYETVLATNHTLCECQQLSDLPK